MLGRRFASSALIRVEGAATEGFLNLCAQWGVELISVQRVDELSLRVSLPNGQLAAAEKAAGRSQCSVELLRRGFGARAGGAARRRAAALVLAAAFIALLFWSKFYVWEIEVSGNETVSTGEILTVLAQSGVETGAFWPGFSSEDIRSRVLVLLPELAWISVNMHGALASVEVVERTGAPELIYNGSPADIVAAKSGFVTAVSAPVGTALVKRGSAVSEGDILISGIVESSFAQPRFLRAYGSVTAETFTNIVAVSPEKTQAKTCTGREKSRFALIIGDKRINFYSDSSISDANCDTIISVWKAEIKGLFSLPVSIVRETARYYETSELSADSAEAAMLLESVLAAELEKQTGGGQVLDSDRKIYASDGLIYASLRARCLEEIGLVQAISPQRMDEINYTYQQKADETNG